MASATRSRSATTVVLALLFLVTGGAKLVALPYIVTRFAQWGYPPWFVYADGIVEVAGGLLILSGWGAGVGALLLAGDMVGACATHLLHGEYAMVPVPLIVLGGAIMIGRAFRPRSGPAQRAG
jgi:putative oxidoreductase